MIWICSLFYVVCKLQDKNFVTNIRIFFEISLVKDEKPEYLYNSARKHFLLKGNYLDHDVVGYPDL